ncbi:MAG TPA: hypothetical protein VGL68_02420 [Solirubrobacteraceae bacterium]|jgi:hypothetical protein
MTIEVRSYRNVFDLERRIYRIDRLRLNPGGVPVRGVVYFLALFATVLIIGSLPVLALAVRALPWYLRDVALPGASAAVLTVIRVEGRPFHLAAQALLRYRSEPRSGTGASTWGSGPRSIGSGGRWRMEEILMLPDGSDGRLRRLRYTGPGAVLVTVAHEHTEGRRWRPRVALILRPAAKTHDLGTGSHRSEPRNLDFARGSQGLASGRQGAHGEGRVIGLAAGAAMLVRADRPGRSGTRQRRIAASSEAGK